MKKEKTITFKIHRVDCQCIVADIENMTLRQEEYGVILELGIKPDVNSVLDALRACNKEVNIIAIKSAEVIESVYTIPCGLAMVYGNVESWKNLGDCYNWFSSAESEVENND